MGCGRQAQLNKRRMVLPVFGLLVVALMTIQHYGMLVGEHCLWRCGDCGGVLFDSSASFSGPTVEIPLSVTEHDHRWCLRDGGCGCPAWSPGHWVGMALNLRGVPNPDEVFRVANRSDRPLRAAFNIQ